MNFSEKLRGKLVSAHSRHTATVFLLSALVAGFALPARGQSTASSGAAPMLSPQPREVHAGGLFAVSAGLVKVPGGEAVDMSAQQNLEARLTQSGVTNASSAAGADLTVELLRDTAA